MLVGVCDGAAVRRRVCPAHRSPSWGNQLPGAHPRACPSAGEHATADAVQ